MSYITEPKKSGEVSLPRDPLLIDLGCGNAKISPEHIGIDSINYPCVDICDDALNFLESLPSEAVDEIFSRHFFEHHHNPIALFKESARVLKTGASLKVIVPHFSNPYFYSDLTHKTPFGLYSLNCFCDDSNAFRRTVPRYNEHAIFRLEDVRLEFQTTSGFLFRSAYKHFLNIVVNSSSYSKELYEELFCWMFPCYEVRYVLVKL
jgi:SAM-dependent methyltransferase